MISKRAFLQSAAGAGVTLFARPMITPASADIGYPARAVRWVVHYTAGGATDVLSRMICERLSQRLGQPFLVENKPGAGSTLGTQVVISSAPDGYTLLLTSTANAINASFDPTLPFDFAKSIAPVAGVARIPLVLVVNNDLPVHDVREFISYAKAHPGKLGIGSSGVGTSLHLSGELFKAMAQVDFIHVPYRGSAPGLTDVMAGQIQGMFDNVTSSFELLRSGKLRSLGITTLAALHDPPETGAFGNVLSPISTRTFRTSTPSASAATWLRIVYVPVPKSCVPHWISTLPCVSIVARAFAGQKLDGYVAVAIPSPTSRFPSRIEPGSGLRRDQPNRSAACW